MKRLLAFHLLVLLAVSLRAAPGFEQPFAVNSEKTSISKTGLLLGFDSPQVFSITRSNLSKSMELLVDDGTLYNFRIGSGSLPGAISYCSNYNLVIGQNCIIYGTNVWHNTAIGWGVLENINGADSHYNLGICGNALNALTNGLANYVIGDDGFMLLRNGANNGGIGEDIGFSSISVNGNWWGGNFAGYYSQGNYNSGWGLSSGYYSTNCSFDVFLGAYSGHDFEDNVQTTNRIANDNFMTMLGAQTHKHASGNLSNSTAVGYRAVVTKSNQSVIGNSTMTECFLNGDVIGTGSIYSSNKVYMYYPVLGLSTIWNYANTAQNYIRGETFFDNNGVNIGGTDAPGVGNLLVLNKIGIGTKSPNSALHVAGPIATSVQVSGAMTFGATNSTIIANQNGLFTLPNVVGINGRIYTLKAVSPATTGVILTNATGDQLIDGATSQTLATTNKYITVQADYVAGSRSNWWIIGNN